MSLDVISFYDDLERRHGLEAVRMRLDSSTAAVKLVAVDGSPLSVGWFENAGKPGAPPGGRNLFALTSVPADARTIHHRLALEQDPMQANVALLREDDSDGYLEGYDDFPTLIDRRQLQQPALGALIMELTDHALVLRTDEADTYAKMSRELPIDGLREYGMELRESRAGLGYVTFG